MRLEGVINGKPVSTGREIYRDVQSMMRVSAIFLPTLVGCIYQPDDIILVDAFVNQIDLRRRYKHFPLKGVFAYGLK